MNNPNCDGSHCTRATGEVRVLPSGGDSNLILCRSCVCAELAWRRSRNKELANDVAFDLPEWDTLKVYDISGGKVRT